jgi:hypothetical protein
MLNLYLVACPRMHSGPLVYPTSGNSRRAAGVTYALTFAMIRMVFSFTCDIYIRPCALCGVAFRTKRTLVF